MADCVSCSDSSAASRRNGCDLHREVTQCRTLTQALKRVRTILTIPPWEIKKQKKTPRIKFCSLLRYQHRNFTRQFNVHFLKRYINCSRYTIWGNRKVIASHYKLQLKKHSILKIKIKKKNLTHSIVFKTVSINIGENNFSSFFLNIYI